MDERARPSISSAKAGRFILSRRLGEAISAIEGLHLSPRMDAALRSGKLQGLSGDERRAALQRLMKR